MPKISLSLAILNDNNLLASSFEDNTIRFANMNVTSLNDIKFNDSISSNQLYLIGLCQA